MTDDNARGPLPAELLPHVSRFDLLNRATLELRDPERGLWCVLRLGSNLSRDGHWLHEPLPSSRTEGFIAATRFTLPEALEVARNAGLVPQGPTPEVSPAPIPAALDELKQRIGEGGWADGRAGGIREVLIRLRDLGLARTDVQVHVERWRAVNDITDRSGRFEEGALDALGILSGHAPAMAIEWPERS